MGRGAQTWTRTCDVCGDHYRLTNWMRLHPWEFLIVDGKAVCIEDTHVRACVRKAEEAGRTVVRRPPQPPAWQLVRKEDAEGKSYIDMVPFTCDPPSHSYSPVGKQGPRKGRPTLGQRCLCKAEQWTPEKDAVLRSDQ